MNLLIELNVLFALHTLPAYGIMWGYYSKHLLHNMTNQTEIATI